MVLHNALDMKHPPPHTHAVHTTLPVGRGGDGDVEGTSVRRTAYNDQQR